MTEHAVVIAGGDPTTSSLIAEVELAREPTWGIRRDGSGSIP